VIYQGVIITNASGKIGGSVWSHNRGGPYVRTNTFPTGGPSSEQTVMRQAMTDTNQGWRDLSAVNRARWALHTLANPRENRIGEEHPIGAWPEYAKANLLRAYATAWLDIPILPVVASPPKDQHGHTPLSQISVAAIADTDTTAELTFSEADRWWSLAGSGLCIFVSGAQTPTTNYFRGPWTLMYAVDNGESSPATIPLPAAAVAGTRLFFKARASDSWGQLSPPAYTHVDIG